MLDIQLLRENINQIADNLLQRGFVLDVVYFQDLEERRKVLQVNVADLQQRRNSLSKEIGIKKRNQENVESLMQESLNVESKLTNIEIDLKDIQNSINDYLLTIPNILDKSVPFGNSEDDNQLYKEWGSKKKFDFTPLEHFEIEISKEQLDFNASAALSGSRFVVMKNKIAKLHRALAQFMMDMHTQKHEYTEVYVPFMVKSHSLYGTGQLPKFKDDFFAADLDSDLWLIPTAEVSLTNLHREEIIAAEQLPLKYVAVTPCFRKESGSYGRDTRGIMRQHQFEKVELVQIVEPETSNASLEELLLNAEAILQALNIHYRVMTLCSKDTGFGATKTYDIEVWLPGQNTYREISSCSNMNCFQSRRMKTRFKGKNDTKTQYPHTLNGSGLAVGRTLIAVLENYQTKDGDVEIPAVLKKYFDL